MSAGPVAGADATDRPVSVGFGRLLWASVIAAVAAALAFVLVLVPELGFHRFVLLVALVAFVVAWMHAALLGMPYAWLLLRLKCFRRLPMMLGGAVTGALPFALFGAPPEAWLSCAALGTVGALAFHAVAMPARARRAPISSDVAASATAPVRVYYNSACPVCRTGIDMQQGAMGACEIEWIDVHANPEAVRELGVDIEAVRERLHVRDAEGVKVGADAAAALWSRTRGLRWLARLLAFPRVRALAQRGYGAFARWLYRWNRRHGRW